jgi:hypothetical protein
MAFAIASEPVWAIGADRTPSSADIEVAHAAIRASLIAKFGAEGSWAPILYGGSARFRENWAAFEPNQSKPSSDAHSGFVKPEPRRPGTALFTFESERR